MPAATLTIGSTTLSVAYASIAYEPPSGSTTSPRLATTAACAGSLTTTVHWEPFGWVEALCLARFGAPFSKLVEELECRRWPERGGPLATWYSNRPGGRLAGSVVGDRN